MQSFGLSVPAAEMDSKIRWKIVFGDMIGSFRFLLDLSLSELLFSCGTSFHVFSPLIAPSLLRCLACYLLNCGTSIFRNGACTTLLLRDFSTCRNILSLPICTSFFNLSQSNFRALKYVRSAPCT